MADVYLVTLGCDKNRVDSEIMIGSLMNNGYNITETPEQAEVIIINTCGFISDAVQESLGVIFELAEYKNENCKLLVIVGCMAERYKDEIKEKIPEADIFIGVGEYDRIAEIIGDKKETTKKNRLLARKVTNIPHIAYVKIAEGCDNCCTYCTIPQIRGAYKSRTMEEILEECKTLVQAGAKELVIVAQDTANYGTDIYGTKKLSELLKKIAEEANPEWIRLMYVYPEYINAALINVIAETPQICKYIDMPLQHSEDNILQKMGRNSGKYELEQLIRVMRDRIPDISIRTTLMVGFPGETEEDFQNLYDFVKNMKFDRMGVFPYSQEENTIAAEMPNQVDEETKLERLNKLMALQQKIHFKKQEAFKNRTVPVMVDEQKEEIYIGRTMYDTYESDSVVEFSSQKKLQQGDIVSVKIIAADGYDLRGIYESSK